MSTTANQPARPALTGVNVGQTERWASAAGGTLLALYGISGRDPLQQLLFPLLGGMLVYRGLTGHCSMYGSLGISTAEGHTGARTAVPAGGGVKVEHSITINRSPQELYRFWRRLDQLPQFMHNLAEVKILDERRSHWVAKAPLGVRVEWDAEIINDRANEVIAWRSLPGATVDTAGSVHFVPAGSGTEVRVSLKYDPPGGKAAATLASWLGTAPEQQIQADLQRFKQMMESGQQPAPGQRDRSLTGSVSV